MVVAMVPLTKEEACGGGAYICEKFSFFSRVKIGMPIGYLHISK